MSLLIGLTIISREIERSGGTERRVYNEAASASTVGQAGGHAEGAALAPLCRPLSNQTILGRGVQQQDSLWCTFKGWNEREKSEILKADFPHQQTSH